MKGYRISLFVLSLLAVILVCFGIGYGVRVLGAQADGDGAESAYETSAEETSVPVETETVPDNRLVINQVRVEPVTEVSAQKERYYLVSETGYLLVFSGDQETVCLQTHIPITDFPAEEQERLRGGIWFESMIDVFAYLESYTS